MPSPTDFPAKGKVIDVRDDGKLVVFNPAGTTYELHLATAAGSYGGPKNVPVQAIVRARGRKAWTVPSGGNFIAPIFGPPRTIQGRVRFADERTIVVQAGTPITIELPAEDAAIDLTNGPIAVGAMVNVVALPGATFELIREPAAV